MTKRSQEAKKEESRLTIDIVNMPGALAAMVTALAKMLRDEAALESDPLVQRRLRDVAARFEGGHWSE